MTPKQNLVRVSIAVPFLALAPLLLSTQVLAQSTPIEISARVGSMIEPDERIYFNMFARVPNFQNAIAYSDDDSLRFAIAYTNKDGGDDTMSLAVGAEILPIVVNYINNFETLENKPSLRTLYQLGIATYTANYRETPDVIVALGDGSTVNGELLSVRENGLILTSTPSSYNWRTDPPGAHFIPSYELNQVSLPSAVGQRRNLILTSIVSAAAIGAAVYSYSDSNSERFLLGSQLALPLVSLTMLGNPTEIDLRGSQQLYDNYSKVIENYKSFQRYDAPEFASVQIPSDSVRMANSRLVPRSIFRPAWHLALAMSVRLAQPAGFDGQVATGTGVLEPTASKRAVALHADLSRDLSRFVRPGVQFSWSPVDEGTTLQDVSTGWSAAAYSDFVLARRDPLFILSKFELSVGVGVGVVHSRATQRVSYSDFLLSFLPELADADTLITASSTVASIPLRATAEFRMSPRHSLFVRASHHIAPSSKIPERSYTYQKGSSSGFIYRIDEYDPRLSKAELVVGTRLHF